MPISCINRYGQNERHKLTAGGSFQIDELRENLSQLNGVFLQNTSLRSELVPGIFAEYSYSIDEKFIIMTGMRVDYNLFYNQLFWTPRVHLKWMPAKNSSIRISLGKGYRTANVVAENISLLVSNRNFVFFGRACSGRSL
jgi:outer membrane receptor for ferrienterochelin and colicin